MNTHKRAHNPPVPSRSSSSSSLSSSTHTQPSHLLSPILLSSTPPPPPPPSEDHAQRVLRIEELRAKALDEKTQAERLMHESARQVHAYQKQFEVTQQAFLDAAASVQALDDELMVLGVQPTSGHEDIGIIVSNKCSSDSDTNSDISW